MILAIVEAEERSDFLKRPDIDGYRYDAVYFYARPWSKRAS
jgi:hypothetical protein